MAGSKGETNNESAEFPISEADRVLGGFVSERLT